VSEERGVACISHGKDSLKMLDVIKSRGLPLNRIVSFDVWATDTISADLPEVAEAKKRIDFYIRGKYGIVVEHFSPVDSSGKKITYEKIFYRKFEKGNEIGRIYGFPFQKSPWCQGRIKCHDRKWYQGEKYEYVGIAADEPLRIKNNGKSYPLFDFDIEEGLCGLHCKYEGILLPTYENGERDGCWFCHNANCGKLRNLRKKYPSLWQLLLKWDKDSPVSFKAGGHTVHDYDRRFQLEDEGYIDPDMPFRWAMLNMPLQGRMMW
jgi:hypothetical protein